VVYTSTSLTRKAVRNKMSASVRLSKCKDTAVNVSTQIINTVKISYNLLQVREGDIT